MFVYAARIPLIALEQHDVTIDPVLLAEARRELVGDSRGAFRSGFLLGVEADAGTHPACLELAGSLQGELELSFMKLAVGVPPAADEGPFAEVPHLDSHPGLTESTELLRRLMNLSTHPRRFLYAATDRWELGERGVSYGRRAFQPLHLPPDVDRRVVVLPGRTETTVHALRFLASAVPHVGLNDPPEHFLLSFEAVVSAV